MSDGAPPEDEPSPALVAAKQQSPRTRGRRPRVRLCSRILHGPDVWPLVRRASNGVPVLCWTAGSNQFGVSWTETPGADPRTEPVLLAQEPVVFGWEEVPALTRIPACQSGSIIFFLVSSFRHVVVSCCHHFVVSCCHHGRRAAPLHITTHHTSLPLPSPPHPHHHRTTNKGNMQVETRKVLIICFSVFLNKKTD